MTTPTTVPALDSDDIYPAWTNVSFARPVPLLLRVWFYLLAFWALSYTQFTEPLRGVRIGYQFYYLEFLFPLAIMPILLKPKSIKLPKWVLLWGIWLLVMGVVGYLKGHLPSLVYDRSRNWGAMILLLLLLYRYQITSSELIRLLKPVFFAVLIGYPLAVVFPPADAEGWVHIADALGFNFMVAAYAIGNLWVYRRFSWWYVWAIGAAIVVPLYLAERAKFLAMFAGLLLPIACTMRQNVRQSLLLLLGLVAVAVTLTFTVGSAKQSERKRIGGGGLNIVSLESTSDARYREREAIISQMDEFEYLIGKGTGATWDGSGLYDIQIGTERQNFHIYYFEIFYWYGLVGIVLWCLVGIVPIVKGSISFLQLNEVGVMGLCSLTALLVSWFGHAGYTMSEGSFIAVSLYAMHCGRYDMVPASASSIPYS
jgi:hypothetical protein